MTSGYLLDTNVISELGRTAPDLRVATWVANRSAAQLNLSAVTIGELTRGIERLVPSRRQDLLRAWLARTTAQFSGRILPLDEAAARRWGHMLATGEKSGRPRSPIDLQIAAIALDRELALVTRDVAGFVDLGLSLIDPWQPA